MKVVIAAAVVIVFISVVSSLSLITNMTEKYNQCKDHVFSDNIQCNLMEFGKRVWSGMTVLGMLFIVSTGTLYILMKSAGARKNTEYFS